MSEDNKKDTVMAEEEMLDEAAQNAEENTEAAEAGDTAENQAAAGEEAPENSEADAEENDDSEATEEGSEAKPEKKGFFGKKKDKKDPRDAQIEELNDRLRRNLAEFDNYRKRTDKEKSAMFEMGAKDIVEKILPVIDNFERGLAAVPEAEKGGAFASGMEMIYKQLLKTLEDAGVKPIEAVGKEFDPNVHNAVMHVDDDSVGDNIIVQEFQKGYMYRDSVIRYSMVQVAN